MTTNDRQNPAPNLIKGGQAIIPRSTTLSEQQREEQRAEIALRSRVILSHFWTDQGTPPPMQVLELEVWCDVLDGCSMDEIRWAWAEYQKFGPRSRSGRLAKPDAGALFTRIMRHRPPPEPPRQEVEPKRVLSDEERARSDERLRELLMRIGRSV